MLLPSICFAVSEALDQEQRRRLDGALREISTVNGFPAIFQLPVLNREYYFQFAAEVHEDDFCDELPIETTLVQIFGHLTVKSCNFMQLVAGNASCSIQ